MVLPFVRNQFFKKLWESQPVLLMWPDGLLAVFSKSVPSSLALLLGRNGELALVPTVMRTNLRIHCTTRLWMILLVSIDLLCYALLVLCFAYLIINKQPLNFTILLYHFSICKSSCKHKKVEDTKKWQGYTALHVSKVGRVKEIMQS